MSLTKKMSSLKQSKIDPSEVAMMEAIKKEDERKDEEIK